MYQFFFLCFKNSHIFIHTGSRQLYRKAQIDAIFTFKSAKLKICAWEAGYNIVQKKVNTVIPFWSHSGSWISKISTCFHCGLASCIKKCHVETCMTALKSGSCVLYMCWKSLRGSFLQKHCFCLHEASIVELPLWKSSNVTQTINTPISFRDVYFAFHWVSMKY